MQKPLTDESAEKKRSSSEGPEEMEAERTEALKYRDMGIKMMSSACNIGITHTSSLWLCLSAYTSHETGHINISSCMGECP